MGERCNMRNCDADRFSQHPADQEEIDSRRAVKKLELANAAEKERIMREMQGNKGEKRVSLYAGQAGGLANPSNKKKILRQILMPTRSGSWSSTWCWWWFIWQG